MQKCLGTLQFLFSPWPHATYSLVFSLLLFGILPANAQAQISLDGSLGPAGFLIGPHSVIPSAFGQIRGPNLFHSFGLFNVPTGGSATFTGPGSIENIIGRVTGGFPSSINGPIQSAIPGANLFLLNPGGFLFGPNARLNVSGSFHVSTADFLRFEDNAVFSTNLADASVLSVATPESFGFLSENPRGISIQGSVLQVPEGETLSVIGGDIESVGSPVLTLLGFPTLGAPGGLINMVSVASPGDVTLNKSGQPAGVTTNNVTRFGEMKTSNATFVNTSSHAGGGTVVIRGGQLIMDQTAIWANTLGSTNGASPGVSLHVEEDATLSNGTSILSKTFGDGTAGNIAIEADSLILTGDARIDSGSGFVDSLGNVTVANGAAGDISITATDISLDNSGFLSQARGEGRAGDITVTTERLTLSQGASINSSNGFINTSGSTQGTGAAGDITVVATDTVTITASQISASTVNGPGGQVSIDTPTLVMEAQGVVQAQTLGNGQAGNVTIDADYLQINEKAAISSSSGFVDATGNLFVGTGAAGNILVSATDVKLDDSVISTLTLGDGKAGDVQVDTDRLTLIGGAQIDSSSGLLTPQGRLFEARGAGGQVTVTAADIISISGRNDAGLLSSILSTTRGEGNAGQVTVTAPVIKLNGGGINTATLGDGKAGGVQVDTDRLTLSGGAQIDSSSGLVDPLGNVTVANGAAGDIAITATDISLDNGGFLSQARGQGRAGDITVTTEHLTLSQGASISSSNGFFDASGTPQGSGAAGDIAITARSAVSLTQGSTISTATVGSAGGQVSINTPTLAVSNGQITASTAGDGDAGDIMLDTDQLTLTGTGGMFSTSGIPNARGAIVSGTGAAGDIAIRARSEVALSQGSIISTATVQGAGGQVSISTPTLTVNKGRVTASTASEGRAGDIVVETERLTLTETALIDSNTLGAGQGGTITVTAMDTVALTNNSGILSDATGSGNAGAVAITTPTLNMESSSLIEARTIGDGNAGEVTVKVERLSMTGLAQIGSTSGLVLPKGDVVVGAGQAGRVTVIATESIHVAGRDADGNVTSGIFSQTLAPPPTGPIDAVNSQVLISTPRLVMEDGSRIGADTGGNARAGDVRVQVQTLSMSEGAQITSSSGIDVGSIPLVGNGPGGNLSLTATDTVTITGQGSGLVTATEDSGQGGNITLQAPKLDLTEGAVISAASSESGDAGSITITLQDTLRSQNSTITTEANAGAGGSIVLQADTLMDLTGTTVSATVAGGSQAGGDIRLTTPTLTLDGGRLEAESGGEGPAGDITLHVASLTATNQATLTSSNTGRGAAGTLAIRGLDGQGTPSSQVALIDSTLATSATDDGAGGSIDIRATDLTLEGATVSATANTGDAGNITIANAETFQSTQSTLTTESTAGAGGAMTIDAAATIDLTETTLSATVTAGSASGGNVTLTAPILTVTGGSIEAESQGAGSAGSITLTTETLVAQAGTDVTSSSTASGAAGTITVQGFGSAGTRPDRVTLTDSQWRTAATGSGTGGAIRVGAHDELTLERTTLSATVHDGLDTLETPRGNITLRAPTLSMVGGSLTAETTGTRNAGGLTLNVGRLTVTDSAQLTSSSTAGATGAAGRVTIEGQEGVSTRADAVTLTDSTVLTRAAGDGAGGSIQIDVTDVTLAGSTLSATTEGVGNAGAIRLAQADTIQSTASRLTTEANAGAGGSIELQADTFIALTDTTVSATVTGGSQAGGDIRLTTPTLTLTGGRVQAETQGAGSAGSITLNADTLTAREQAQITSSSFSDGPGGTITVASTGTVAITGSGSGLLTQAEGTGSGGDIALQAGDLRLTQGATISARSTGPGDAGNIRITTAATFVSADSTITTEAAQAAGGDITVLVPTMIRLDNSAITASVAGGPETVGGNITIDPEFVILENSQIIAQATEGQGGNISIEAGVFLADPTSAVSASSERGIQGEVDIRTPVADLSGSVVSLPQDFEQAAALLRQRCAERLRGGQMSSFVVTGRDGLPADPEGGLPSPIISASTVPNRPQRSSRKPSTALSGLMPTADARSLQLRGWFTETFLHTALAHDCSGLLKNLHSFHPTQSGH